MYNTEEIKNKAIAADIYNYLKSTYYGTSPEEIQFRVSYGSNGVVDKVLNYIYSKYLKERQIGSDCSE